MKKEEVLFDIFNEFILLAELYEKLSSHQVVTFIEDVSARFSELDPDVLNSYKIHLEDQIKREKARGATERNRSGVSFQRLHVTIILTPVGSIPARCVVHCEREIQSDREANPRVACRR
jgi:hypothetical protein